MLFRMNEGHRQTRARWKGTDMAMKRFNWLAYLVLTMLLVVPELAHAHAETAEGGGFWAGLTHPVLGLDHMAAMVAVGLWGVFLGAPAIWLLPIIFPLVMALGAIVGLSGIALPLTELIIALSGLVLGLMILFKVQLNLVLVCLLVGLFAVFHGYAHGAELPATANPYAFIIGFVIATGALHVAGILLGTLTRWPAGLVAVRSAGAVIAGLGAMFLYQLA